MPRLGGHQSYLRLIKDQSNTLKSAVVVGAGLAGLTAAIYLERNGFDVRVLEASDRVGGRVATDLVDGYRCDRGFQVINPNYSEIRKLDALQGIEFKEMFTDLRIQSGSGELKVGLSHLGQTIKVGSFGEKLSLLHFLRGRGGSDLTFGQKSSGFSTIRNQVLDPFLKGVFLTPAHEARADIAREILKSFIFARPGVPELGVGQFSERLAAEVSNIQLNATVHEVSKGKVVGDFGTIKCDVVVVATDSTTASQLLDLHDVYKVLESTTWYHSTDQNLMDLAYLAIDTRSPLINSVVISEVSKEYAPAGKHLISSTALVPISESEVRKELSKIWKCETRDWDLVALYNIKQSLPFRSTGGALQLAVEVGDAIFVAGDHRDLPSQNGAMRSGRRAALAAI